MAINFDDQSTGISYQQFPKDPQAREQIQILDNKVDQLEQKTVSKQAIIDIESKVRQSELDKENFKIAVTKELTDVKTVVEGIDGGNVEKIAEIEAAVNLKANKDVVDSLLNQIEGSVKQINGIAPDGEGNVIIDVNTAGLATKQEVTAKTDELAGLVFSKAEKADVQTLASQLAETVKEVNGVKPLDGKLTIPIPVPDTSALATKAELTTKVEKTYVDTQISSLGQLKLDGQYDTLAALQTAIPTGTAGKIYLVIADGFTYRWLNGAWTKGAQFQSTGIADGAVTSAKTTSLGSFGLIQSRDIPNFDLINNVLTIARPATLLVKNKFYTLDDGTNDLSINIDFTGDWEYAVYYNTSTKIFSMKAYWVVPSEFDVLIATVSRFVGKKTAHMAGVYTVNGQSPLPANTITTTHIKKDAITWDKLAPNTIRQYEDDIIYYAGLIVVNKIGSSVTVTFDGTDNRLFHKNKDGGIQVTLNTLSYTIPNNNSLVYNKTTKLLEVVDTDAIIRGTHALLLTNHLGYIKKANVRYESANLAVPVANRTIEDTRSFTFAIDQDGCVVEDEVWMFIGSSSSHVGNATIHRLNKETLAEIGTISYNLGHANGVDYKNNKLIVFNGGGYPPEINLYSNPYGKSSLQMSDANNVQIVFKEGNKLLEGDGAACFGENERIVFYNAGSTIYKILLGMGDNDLSDKTTNKTDMTLWGTFVSGKSNTEYNGTAKVIGKYTGYIPSNNQPQGMHYDGFLYLGTGFSSFHAYKVQLYDNGTFEIVDDYKYNYSDYKNAPVNIEPEAVFIIGNYIYVGARTATESHLAKFKL